MSRTEVWQEGQAPSDPASDLCSHSAAAAVACLAHGSFTISNTIFSRNAAFSVEFDDSDAPDSSGLGGALKVVAAARVWIRLVAFENNQADVSGGSIFAYSGAVDVTSAVFHNSRADTGYYHEGKA